MKPLLILAALALATLFVVTQSDDASPTNPAICPECPGGVCPVDKSVPRITFPIDGSKISLQENTPIQVEPVPVFTLAKHDKSLIKPEIKKPDTKVREGAKGWRLRLLYTKGDKQAIKFQHWFENRMPVISKKYGFTAIASDEETFEPWQKAGYSAEKPMLVLACPNDDIALRTTEIPTDIDELRKLIRESAEKFKDHVDR